jgi:hypothetical protein
VVLNTTDSSTPVLVLECLPGSDALREKVRGAVEACRERKHVRYAELGGEVETEPPPSAG